MSLLDQSQILQKLYDETSNSLNVHAKFAYSDTKIFYNEILNLDNSIVLPIFTFRSNIPVQILEVEASGTNIATFELKKEEDTLGKQRTYFSSPLNILFDLKDGIKLDAGQQLFLFVSHNRPSLGDFNATIKYKEIS